MDAIAEHTCGNDDEECARPGEELGEVQANHALEDKPAEECSDGQTDDGTWFIAMRLAQGAVDTAALPEARDCLVNVDVHGQPVPSCLVMPRLP